MTIISRHPYSFLFAGAGIVLLAMLLLVRNQTTPATEYAPFVSVSAGNSLVNPGISIPDQTTNAPQPSPIEENSSSTAIYVPIPVGQNNPSGEARSPTNAASPPTAPSGTQTPASAQPSASDQLLNYVYSLIPSGIALPTVGATRTPTQQALFAYGNEAGGIVLAFDDAHADMAQVLKDWLADRTSAAKIASVQSIAHDMQTAGRSLAALKNVPSVAASANQGLAKGYEDAGDKLLAVAASGGSDATLVDAMKAYDATVDSFTGAYVSLADIFSLYAVTFNTNDTGGAFVFSGAGGL